MFSVNSFCRFLFVVSFVLLTNIAIAQQDEYVYPSECTDYLRQLDPQLPKIFQYQQCTLGRQAQLSAFIATYKVSGKDVVAAEQYMINKYQIIPLKFVCCHWEDGTSFGRHYRDPETKVNYYISMGSEETLINQRQYWTEIPFFYVSVNVPLEEP